MSTQKRDRKRTKRQRLVLSWKIRETYIVITKISKERYILKFLSGKREIFA